MGHVAWKVVWRGRRGDPQRVSGWAVFVRRIKVDASALSLTLVSSANLATSYFTNRQDRYIHFQSHPSLLSYLSSLTRLFTHYSYLLSPSPSPSVSRHHLVPL